MTRLRILDVILSAVGLVAGFPVMLVVTVLLWLELRSPLFLQQRVGRHGKQFTLVKFRTMKPGTPSVPSHLANPQAITRLGSILRRTKLDELPQLWNVIVGEMSLVGPRPCLPSQTALIDERRQRQVDQVRPGITGLAQVKGIDMSTPVLLAEIDAAMVREMNVYTYLRLIALTVFGGGRGDRVPMERHR
jgi:lipopolysaccharide/colanic/teichoic acid biosynthesis glycosyltransferase